MAKEKQAAVSPEGRGNLEVKQKCLWLWRRVKRLPRHPGFPLISWAPRGDASALWHREIAHQRACFLQLHLPQGDGGNTRTGQWVSLDRSCPPKFPVRVIYMVLLCSRPIVSQELKPSPALAENSYCYGICFVEFKATHTKMKQSKFGVSHPLHTDQSCHSHFCIWIISLDLHLRPFCNVTFGLTPNMNNYPALITSIFCEHSSCKCAM